MVFELTESNLKLKQNMASLQEELLSQTQQVRNTELEALEMQNQIESLLQENLLLKQLNKQ